MTHRGCLTVIQVCRWLVVGATFAATGCSLIVSSDDDPVFEQGECAESCTSGVCDGVTGSCVPESEIIYLDASSGISGDCGARDRPCKTLIDAFPLLDDTRRTLLLQNGDFGDLILDGQEIGRLPVLVVGRNATIHGNDANHALSAWNGITVRAENLTLRDAGYVVAGAYCQDGASLRLVSVDIHSNDAHGIIAETCSELTVESSTVRLNGASGVFIRNSPFVIVNTVIAQNGSPSGTYASVRLEVGPEIVGRFEFNTVAENQSGATPWGVDCTSGADLDVSNNIVVATGQSGAAVGGACGWTYSDIQVDDGENTQPGEGNFFADPSFVDPDGDFHLREGSPCIDRAADDAELERDFEDDPRQHPADVGADEYR